MTVLQEGHLYQLPSGISFFSAVFRRDALLHAPEPAEAGIVLRIVFALGGLGLLICHYGPKGTPLQKGKETAG